MTRVVKPKPINDVLQSHSKGAQLRCQLFDFFQENQQENLSLALLGWTTSDLPFRELAYFILCLAAAGEYFSLTDHRNIIVQHLYGVVAGVETADEVDFISSLGSGCHKQGLPIGSAPSESKYWFEGALVSLVPRLDQPGNLEGAVADALQYGRSSFNAVLISIEHFVLLKSFPSGRVDHSKLLSLLSIPVHMSKNARDRCGDQQVDIFYAEEEARQTESGKEDMQDYSPSSLTVKQPTMEQSGLYAGVMGGLNTVEGEEQTTSTDTGDTREDGEDLDAINVRESTRTDKFQEETNEKSQWMGSGNFASLIAFFEAMALESLTPRNNCNQHFPVEICDMILSYVSDIKTHIACAKVSRYFRSLSHRRPVLVDDVMLVEPQPPNILSSNPVEKRSQHQWSKYTFRALNVSSGVETNVSLQRKESTTATTCFMVAGNERDRRSFLQDHPIRFEGLITSSDKSNLDQLKKNQASTRSDGPHPINRSKDNAWDATLDLMLMRCNRPLNHESRSYDLETFWSSLITAHYETKDRGKFLHEVGPPVSMANKDWEMAPNTRRLRSTWSGSRKDGGDFHLHYLQVQMRRKPKYWDSSWNDSIRDATSWLQRSNAEHYGSFRTTKDSVIGAEDPFVLLTIGLEVRLFRWVQGFDESVKGEARRKMSPSSTLAEITPGRIYSIMEADDRKEMEKFLDLADQHRHEVERLWE